MVVQELFWSEEESGTKGFHLTLTLCFTLAGAQGQQEAVHVGALHGPHPRRLCHESRVHVGGPTGPQCVSSSRPARAPQRYPEQKHRPTAQPHAAAPGRRREEGEVGRKYPQHLNVFWLNSLKTACADYFTKNVIIIQTAVDSPNTASPPSCSPA